MDKRILLRRGENMSKGAEIVIFVEFAQNIWSKW
jgi:hypothetical protein